MTKEEFIKEFKNLIDCLPIPRESWLATPIEDVANRFSVAKKQVSEWYNGLSAPLSNTRNDIIEYLYAEVKTNEMRELIRQTIKNELRVKVEFYGDDVEVVVYLGKEMIDSYRAYK